MEILLNALWLLIAAGAVAVWGVQQAGPERGRQRALPTQLLALACTLILLFPVISLTDDLHAQQAVMEDSSRTIVKARRAAEGCFRAGKSPVPALLGPAFSEAATMVLGLASMPKVRHSCLYQILPSQGRSPPRPPC